MSILTYSEYCSFRTGTNISESEFDTLSFYAESAISSYIKSRKVDSTVKRATAMQIALSVKNGGVDYYSELSKHSDVTSENLGDYSYSKSIVSDSKEQSEYGLFPIVVKMLSRDNIEAVNVIL